MCDEHGQVVGVALVFRNLTGQRRAEEALRDGQRQLQSIIGSAMDAIISVDEQQRIILFNAAAEQMFHCPATEALGTAINRFIPARFHRQHQEHVRTFGQTKITKRTMGALGAIFGLREGRPGVSD